MTKKLRALLEEKEFIVRNASSSENPKAIEIEGWTKGGVNMIIYLNKGTDKEFKEYVENFDIDEEIELHRQDSRYSNVFTIRQSLEDFESYKKTIALISNSL